MAADGFGNNIQKNFHDMDILCLKEYALHVLSIAEKSADIYLPADGIRIIILLGKVFVSGLVFCTEPAEQIYSQHSIEAHRREYAEALDYTEILGRHNALAYGSHEHHHQCCCHK